MRRVSGALWSLKGWNEGFCGDLLALSGAYPTQHSAERVPFNTPHDCVREEVEGARALVDSGGVCAII